MPDDVHPRSRRLRLLLAVRVAFWLSLPAAVAGVLLDRGLVVLLGPVVLFALLIALRYVRLPAAWDHKHPPQFSGCMFCESWTAATGREMVQPLRDLDEL